MQEWVRPRRPGAALFLCSVRPTERRSWRAWELINCGRGAPPCLTSSGAASATARLGAAPGGSRFASGNWLARGILGGRRPWRWVGCRPSLRHPPGLLRPSHSPGTHSIMLGGAGSPGALGAGPLRWLVGLCGGVSALALGVVRGLSATWERAFLAADSEMMRPLPLRAVSLACFPFGAKMRDTFVGTIRCGTESSLAIDRHPDEYCDCRCD